MQLNLYHLLAQFSNLLQQRLFPLLEKETGPLSCKQQQFVKVLAMLGLDAHLERRRGGRGRPAADRIAIARAFVAKAIFQFPLTTVLLEQLKADATLRRLCGWERAADIPGEWTFSRAFAEFAASELPQRMHAALIEQTQGERLIGHISRDSTAIEAREKPVKKTEPKPTPTETPAPAPKRKGRPKRGEIRPAPEAKTRVERQRKMKLEEMLADLPRVCDVGCKTNSKGHKSFWRGYKLHLDIADGGIPISAILTSASLHDSQVAIPLATMTAKRVRNLYDLMDSAYDSQAIREHSMELGHVPIIETLQRRSGKLPFAPHQAVRYRNRTASERANASLKEDFGARYVRVRGAAKVMAHLMFGILVLTAERILRLQV